MRASASQSFQYINHLSQGKSEANIGNRFNIWLYHKITDSMNGYDFGDGIKQSIKDYKTLSHSVAKNIVDSTEPEEEKEKRQSNEARKITKEEKKESRNRGGNKEEDGNEEEEYYKISKNLTRRVIKNISNEFSNEVINNNLQNPENPYDNSQKRDNNSDLFGF